MRQCPKYEDYRLEDLLVKEHKKDTEILIKKGKEHPFNQGEISLSLEQLKEIYLIAEKYHRNDNQKIEIRLYNGGFAFKILRHTISHEMKYHKRYAEILYQKDISEWQKEKEAENALK